MSVWTLITGTDGTPGDDQDNEKPLLRQYFRYCQGVLVSGTVCQIEREYHQDITMMIIEQ